jgi:hypothetical protein
MTGSTLSVINDSGKIRKFKLHMEWIWELLSMFKVHNFFLEKYREDKPW